MTVYGFSGPNGASYELGTRDGRWTFGSAATATFVLENIAPIACVLERQQGVLLVRRKDASCPILVDGNRVLAAEVTVGARLQIGTLTLTAVAQARLGRRNLVGQAPVFLRAVDRALRVAPSDCAVLLLGETGTGKEVLAQALHQASKRRNGPFVAINCGAIPRELLAAELFGHDKGAFTGATHDRDGVFVQAEGGTLFLDEIGELPLDQQAHLLRVLETRRVRPVGSAREIPIDVRIVAATHRQQGLGTESAMLRLDLYHRIATVVVELPPLRQRVGDIELLVHAALDEHAADGSCKTVSLAALQALAAYEWPGNVRELRHAVARAVALGGALLEIEDFFPGTEVQAPAPLASIASEGSTLAPYEEILRQAMGRALVRKGSIRKAAKELGMPKSTFAQRAKSYGLLQARPKRIAQR
ncbi:MAG TPA: sigma 54-dependent Fis family transcriptional regulator [Kofleriaceae bacterium]|nr:sigma 54-dependent Fis family transcriptional regulator [Kofleriaceae bacterium]